MKPAAKICIFIVLLIPIIYLYPKALVSTLGADNPWTSYLYQYSFGLICFGIGMKVITASGALVRGRGRETFWYRVLISGFAAYALIHALWIVAALELPYYGGTH